MPVPASPRTRKGVPERTKAVMRYRTRVYSVVRTKLLRSADPAVMVPRRAEELEVGELGLMRPPSPSAPEEEAHS